MWPIFENAMVVNTKKTQWSQMQMFWGVGSVRFELGVENKAEPLTPWLKDKASGSAMQVCQIVATSCNSQTSRSPAINEL